MSARKSATKTRNPNAAGHRTRLVDVAAAAGVTVSVVSRVLNDDPTMSIRPGTRMRVIEAAQELAYRPNALARGLRRSRTMTIGMVLPNLASGVNAEIIRGAASRAATDGYVVLIADAAEFGPTSAAYQRLLLEGRVDGLLIASTSTNEEGLASLSSLRLPVVFVNRRGNKFGISVSVDDEHGIALGVDHLVELGHTEIAHIAGPRDIDTARRRRAGFVTRMRHHGLKVAPSSISETTSFSELAGYEAMERLLAKRRPPSAVIAATFASAVGAVSAIGKAGFDVPGDISVVGFHDPPIAQYLNPPLTTIQMPLASMAETAVTTLVRMIEGVDVEDVIVTSPEPALIKHDSTGPRP